ncbi:hypothetical protein B0T26DRAFT_658813 [Lasiosphaeria miniovina]|uniref:Uncharacterized protein n=1 Tax=Lasiosphaeria miniovina TaxID=1954250 RepID=A0AA40DIY0_9PEZI|nr:uncharacterized protein B0T26DRAFT_658813 [Lasiosphaeria miniovina]KAK0703041.1 hypothetical protein B0T26DRAFT_658813 [Lasiosphaeria miniovina]
MSAATTHRPGTGLGRLGPPFSHSDSRSSVAACIADLPVSITSRGRTLRPARDLAGYLRSELLPWKLDLISSHLWFAGPRHVPARSLHRHRLARREIVITESPSEHLISDYTVVFVKPLPSYLLCYDFWATHLAADASLYAAACGLLLSYTWLIAYPTDFDIAKELRLLPADLAWSAWTSFVSGFLDHLEALGSASAYRYTYGELRMSRVNYLYKFVPSVWDRDNPARGFMPTSMWNKSFLERNVARLLTVFVAISLALSAMQVGLATAQLQQDDFSAFVSASYGFAVASLVLVLLCGGAVLVAAVWHFRYKILRPWRMHVSKQGTQGHNL